MRRILLAAAVVAASFGPGTGPASADVCVGNLLCTVSGCEGTVNVCPTARSCSGGVSVCPAAHPDHCHSSVDICLGLIPAISCGPQLQPVCDIIPTGSAR